MLRLLLGQPGSNDWQRDSENAPMSGGIAGRDEPLHSDGHHRAADDQGAALSNPRYLPISGQGWPDRPRPITDGGQGTYLVKRLEQVAPKRRSGSSYASRDVCGVMEEA